MAASTRVKSSSRQKEEEFSSDGLEGIGSGFGTFAPYGGADAHHAQGNQAMQELLRLRSEDSEKGASAQRERFPFQSEMERLFDDDFSDVRVRVGAAPRCREQGAEAMTAKNEVSFASGAPDRDTVAHELTHIVQQRRGSPDKAATETRGDVDLAEHQAETVARRVARGEEAKLANQAVTAAPDKVYRKSNASQVPTKGGYHTIAAGESLWSIAERWYQNGEQWHRIYQANQERIGGTPNVIAEGMSLFIPAMDVAGKLGDETSEGMDIANQNQEIQYPHVPIRTQTGPQSHPKGYLDPKYWEYAGQPWTFRLKDGKSASEAIEMLFVGPTRLECLSMTYAVLARSVRETVGEEIFDKEFGKEGEHNQDLIIGTNSASLDASKLKKLLVSPNPKDRSELRTGDCVYFKNYPKYLAKHPTGAWQGENAIYKGNGIFSGFGADSLSENEMNQELADAYNDAPSSDDMASSKFDPSLKQHTVSATDVPGLQLKSCQRLDANKVDGMLQ